MRWTPAVAGLLFCFPTSPCGAQDLAPARQPLSPDVLLLARIKAKAVENLQRLPNYTCTQTIERSRRGAKARKFEPLDTLRLEVALVEGRQSVDMLDPGWVRPFARYGWAGSAT